MNKANYTKRYGFGLVVLLVGIVLLLDNFGVIPYEVRDVIFRWPMIFVLIGLINVINREWTSALILFLIGAFFLLPTLSEHFSYHSLWRFWPVLLIIAGFGILKGRKSSGCHRIKDAGTNSTDYLDVVAVFGSSTNRIRSDNFRGGEIVAVFGGCEIYLTDAILSPEGGTLDIVTVFGGTKLYVPRNWHVKVESSNVLGGYVDKRVGVGENIDMTRTLKIEGVNVFGGVELLSM